MYACKNCAANLRFEINIQKLICDSCDSTFAVDEYEDRSLHKPEFEANVFLCPQCGGEIFTQDNDMTGRCTYCGTTQVFKSRVERVKRPKYIIPFKRDKESCKKIYEGAVKKAFYAPKELKDPEFINSIRGVYMPYWIYENEYNLPISLTGVENNKSRFLPDGKFLVVRDRIDNHFHSRFLALKEDASSFYWDEVSDNVRPFQLKSSSDGLKPFNPAYLCGFYGETADVKKPPAGDKRKYEIEISKRTEDFVYHYHNNIYPESGMQVLREPQNSDYELGLLPVWFLSFKRGKRVSYSVINGQSGRFAAEFPVDNKKFFACTAILAVVFYLILNLFWIMRPEYVAMAAAIGSLWAIRLADIDFNEIARKACEMVPVERRKYVRKPPRRWMKVSADTLLPYLIVILLIFMENSGHIDRYPHGFMAKLPMIFTIGVLLRAIYELFHNWGITRRALKNARTKVFPGHYLAFLSIVAALIVQIIHPVSDYIYFGVGFGCMAMTVISLLSVILAFNRMVSRPMPQFEHMGGDDRAK